MHCDYLKGHCTGPQSLIQTECGILCFSDVRYLSKYYIALTAQTLLFLYQSIWIFTLNEISQDYKYPHISSGKVLQPDELQNVFGFLSCLDFRPVYEGL